jgi:uncharacterized UBP type Zn finger protein
MPHCLDRGFEKITIHQERCTVEIDLIASLGEHISMKHGENLHESIEDYHKDVQMTHSSKQKRTIRSSHDIGRSTKAADTAAAITTTANTESPLDYMLRVMRDPDADDERRDAMAKAALPYMHARLSNVDGQVPNKEDGPISFTWQPPQK